ncbi:hypothetical protein LZK80_17330 [Rhizobium leguminosarum]|nr:hypothetical protein LZK80_17330 [Rhizobium leguminosarum]
MYFQRGVAILCSGVGKVTFFSKRGHRFQKPLDHLQFEIVRENNELPIFDRLGIKPDRTWDQRQRCVVDQGEKVSLSWKNTPYQGKMPTCLARLASSRIWIVDNDLRMLVLPLPRVPETNIGFFAVDISRDF